MSLLAAAARARAPHALPAIRQARRGLGETTVGPAALAVKANWQIAKTFFTRDPVSYREFKQQCSSLRLFAFIGVNVFVVGSLWWCPPKSSYWIQYSPMHCFHWVAGWFVKGHPAIFLTEKLDRDTNVPDVYTQLSTLRRVEGAGGDEHHEH